jgi:hypothetical protein
VSGVLASRKLINKWRERSDIRRIDLDTKTKDPPVPHRRGPRQGCQIPTTQKQTNLGGRRCRLVRRNDLLRDNFVDEFPCHYWS